MTLSEELTWRGFLEQTTFKDIKAIDSSCYSFYWGVDPSADSMTVGNLALAMLVKHFIRGGHKAVLLVGGATGLIGDPDGKANERELKTPEIVNANKQAITNQYKNIFDSEEFEIVDNLDWFKDISYLNFLRDIGKHVPMSQMLAREFIQTRLGEQGSGISYAEFSYVLIQAYDFLTLYKNKSVSLQIAGSDQWGNSIAGVELIRRLESANVNVWTAPLIIDRTTGQKFGKTEAGAIWLDAQKTSPTAFYQFWINIDDQDVEKFLKIYTMLDKQTIDNLMNEHRNDPKGRKAQKALAAQVTTLVHGDEQTAIAEAVTGYLIGDKQIDQATEEELSSIRQEIPSIKSPSDLNLINLLVSSGLASSNTQAKSLLSEGAIYIKGQTVTAEELSPEDFDQGRLLIRRGKAFKDSALIEL
ncbi:MAG: tyrosine--tRNA ligase [Candidatus Saccharimonadales bacterium]